MPWFKRFADPIVLADRRELKTLDDAVRYISELPKAEQDAAEWQLAMEALIMVADTDAPSVLARTAVVNALKQHGRMRVNRVAKIIRIFERKPKDASWPDQPSAFITRPYAGWAWYLTATAIEASRL